jgi:hypothetical protein
MTTNKQTHYRQGDVLVECVDEIPEGVQPIDRDHGRSLIPQS